MDKRIEEQKVKLKGKQARWAHEYIIDWNATGAARRAGYSEKSAKDAGYSNKNNAEIQAYIELIKDNLEEEAHISKLQQIQKLKAIAETSIADLHNSWLDRKAFEKLTDEQKSAIESIETRVVKRKDGIYEEVVDVEQVKIKLYSALQARDMLNKMLGYYEAEKKGPPININPTVITWGSEKVEV